MKKRLATREPMPLMVPLRPNQIWSADFMSDVLYHGMRFRTFNVLDDFNREVLAIEIDTSLSSMRLIRVFEQLIATRGLPDVLRTDNGPEFLGQCFTTWCRDNSILIDYIEPGKTESERLHRTIQPNRSHGGTRHLVIQSSGRSQRDHLDLDARIQRGTGS